MNIGVIAPFPDRATSFYRAFGPLGKLSRSHDVKLITYSEWGWPELVQCDVLFMQFPYDAMACRVMKLAKQIGVKVWIDYDDLYTEPFPFAHPERENFNQSSVQDALRWLMSSADLVTVSTNYLAEKMSFCNPKVIPNAWDEDIWPMSTLQPEKVISWRGGPANGHGEDLEQVLPQIKDLVDKLPDWKWIFFGVPHWKIATTIPLERLAIVQQMPILDYLPSLCRARPSVHIVPLADNPFNRAKSNCAWIEASIAGAVTVAPEFDEFEKAGVYNYKDDFVECVMAASYSTSNTEAREWIQDNLTLRAINKQRFALLESLWQ